MLKNKKTIKLCNVITQQGGGSQRAFEKPFQKGKTFLKKEENFFKNEENIKFAIAKLYIKE